MDGERRKSRSLRTRKRRFHGNQHSKTRGSSEASVDQQQREVFDTWDNCGFVCSEAIPPVTTESASKTKLDNVATPCADR